MLNILVLLIKILILLWCSLDIFLYIWWIELCDFRLYGIKEVLLLYDLLIYVIKVKM